MSKGPARTLAALVVLVAAVGRLQALDLDEIEKRGTLRVLRSASWSQLVVKYFGEQAPEVLKKARTEAP